MRIAAGGCRPQQGWRGGPSPAPPLLTPFFAPAAALVQLASPRLSVTVRGPPLFPEAARHWVEDSPIGLHSAEQVLSHCSRRATSRLHLVASAPTDSSGEESCG